MPPLRLTGGNLVRSAEILGVSRRTLQRRRARRVATSDPTLGRPPERGRLTAPGDPGEGGGREPAIG